MGLARRAPRISHRDGVRYRLDGRPVVGLCSNDYLGLADRRPRPSEDPPPSGAAASRLVCGDLPIHRELERSLARLAGTEDAVLFPSGFQLNVGVLPALLGASDRVFSDALNHASLIDGLRLASAARTVLPHAQPPPPPDADPARLSWWVTEAIFSMDGDRVDAVALGRHLRAGGCAYVDEAHAFGLFPGGTGLSRALGLSATVSVYTLGKALGCAGACVAASATVCEWLRTRARSLVFSTALAPPIAERIAGALELVTGSDGDTRRARLWAHAAQVASAFGAPGAASPIFPVAVGDNARALSVSDALLAAGWHVQPIRPPTVPPGTARLRVTVTAAHTPELLAAFLRDLARVLSDHDLPMALHVPAPPTPFPRALA
jgi:7-keto-8-aminopelargonate synthetase-like enzyme